MKIKKTQVWVYQDQVEHILKDHYNELSKASNKAWFNPKTKKKRKSDTKTIANWKRVCTRIHKKYTKKLKEAVQWQGLIAEPFTVQTVNYEYDGNNLTRLTDKSLITPTKGVLTSNPTTK